MRHKTPLLVSPAVRPHPQPSPVPDTTVASATQFAPLCAAGVGAGEGTGVVVGGTVACVGDRTPEHAERRRAAASMAREITITGPGSSAPRASRGAGR